MKKKAIHYQYSNFTRPCLVSSAFNLFRTVSPSCFSSANQPASWDQLSFAFPTGAALIRERRPGRGTCSSPCSSTAILTTHHLVLFPGRRFLSLSSSQARVCTLPVSHVLSVSWSLENLVRLDIHRSMVSAGSVCHSPPSGEIETSLLCFPVLGRPSRQRRPFIFVLHRLLGRCWTLDIRDCL